LNNNGSLNERLEVAMPTILDVALLAALVAWSLAEHLVLLPRSRRAAAQGLPGARIQNYRRIAAAEWALAALTLALWLAQHRSLAALGLALPTGWRLVGAVAVVVLVAALAAMQARSLAAIAREGLAKRGRALPEALRFILPQSPAERVGFTGLSLTAGVCEELIARGWLIAFFGAWMGPWWAALASSAVFGLGHSYQGVAGAAKAGAAGMVMAAIYLLTGSLLPGMIVHALVDISSGHAAGVMLEAAAESPIAA
jgi:membrane protease YdiL (CAAX protease family)